MYMHGHFNNNNNINNNNIYRILIYKANIYGEIYIATGHINSFSNLYSNHRIKFQVSKGMQVQYV